jgi:hypothetical protein
MQVFGPSIALTPHICLDDALSTIADRVLNLDTRFFFDERR